MKQIFTHFLMLAMGMPFLAIGQQTLVTLTNGSAQPVQIQINGQWVNDQQGMLRIATLNPGTHRIQVFVQENRNGWGANNRGRLVYNSNFQLRPGMHVDFVINRFARVYRDERPYD